MPARAARAVAPALPTPRPIWQTEQGMDAADGIVHPRTGTRLASLMYFCQNVLTKDRLGVHTSPWWYDNSHGFDPFPEFYTGITAVGPQVLPTRTMAAELYDKRFVSELNFGTYGQDLYVGAKWANAAGAQTIGILTASYGLADVQIAVSSGTNFTYVDPWGNTSTLTASGGKVTMPVMELPGWLHVPAGIVADLVPTDWQWGKNYTTEAVASTAGTAAKLHYLVEETIRNPYDVGQNDPTIAAAPYSDTTGAWDGTGFPKTWTWDYRRTVTLDRLVLHSFVPFQHMGTLLDFDIQTSTDNATWTTRYTRSPASTDTSAVHTTNAWRSNYVRFWDEQHIFDVKFSPASVRYVRLLVRNASTGSTSLAEQQWIYSLTATWTPNVVVARLGAFYTAGTNTQIQTKAYANPTDMHGCIGWYDASDSASIISSGGQVSQWSDKSGYGRHLTQATSANQPTTGTNINGVAALTFNGTSQQISYAGFTSGVAYLIGTVVFVAIAANHTATQYVLRWDTNSVGGITLDTNAKMNTQTGNDGFTLATSNTFTNGTGFLASVVINGALSVAAINGTSHGGTTLGTHVTQGEIMVGSSGGGNYFTGQIGALVLFRDILNPSELAVVTGQLKTQWGTP